MNESELVSVVIPCYNHAQFLGGAIESVLAQSYPEVEIVVVDDGSPDDTAGVAAGYPSVKLVQTTNQGLSRARNNGIAAGTGSLYVFLDADDRLTPGAIEASVACLDANPNCGMVFGRHFRVHADGSRVNDPPQARVGGDAYEALLRGNAVGAIDAVLWRAEAIRAVGGFDVSLPAAEDYDLFLRMAQRYPAVQHDAVVVQVLLHDAGMHRDLALMLQWTITALRRQHPHVHDNPRHREAYRAGLRWWRETYGVRLAEQTPRRLASPRTFRRGARDLCVLLRFYPGVVAHALRRGPARISRRLASSRARTEP